MKENLAIGYAGKFGDKVRSDCFVKLQLTNRGGIQSTLQSKVDSLYGQRINDLVLEMCDFFEIKNAKIEIVDYGALDFTITARFEAAYKILIQKDDCR